MLSYYYRIFPVVEIFFARIDIEILSCLRIMGETKVDHRFHMSR